MTTISSSTFECAFGVWTRKIPTCLVVLESAALATAVAPFSKSSVTMSIDAQPRDPSAYLISE